MEHQCKYYDHNRCNTASIKTKDHMMNEKNPKPRIALKNNQV